MSAATLGTAYLEKSAAAAQQDQQDQDMENQGHRRRNHDLLQGEAGDHLYDFPKEGSVPSPAVAMPRRRASVFSGVDEEVLEMDGSSSVAQPPSAAQTHPSSLQPAPSRSTNKDNRSGKGVSSHMDDKQQKQCQQQSDLELEQRLRDLRSPYEHLRAELLLVQGQQQNHPQSQESLADRRPSPATPSRRGESTKHGDDWEEGGESATAAGISDILRGSSSSDGESGGGRRVGLGLTSSSRGQKQRSQGEREVLNKQGVRGFEGSSLNNISGEDITAPGVSTSIIADDLEILLRKFVQADRRSRREMVLLARKYYDELDINFPNVSVCLFQHLPLILILFRNYAL
jgi:hypothetical protein